MTPTQMQGDWQEQVCPCAQFLVLGPHVPAPEGTLSWMVRSPCAQVSPILHQLGPKSTRVFGLWGCRQLPGASPAILLSEKGCGEGGAEVS